MNESYAMRTIDKDGKPYVSVINENHTFSLQNHTDRKTVQLDKSCLPELIELLNIIREN